MKGLGTVLVPGQCCYFSCNYFLITMSLCHSPAYSPAGWLPMILFFLESAHFLITYLVLTYVCLPVTYNCP